MELRHLKYFVAVAEELNFGRAARRLHIAQPPLSQQIMDLERELSVMLFDRSSRRAVRLTDAGQFFLAEARQILLHASQAAETARRIDRGQVGRIAVGFVGSVVHTFLPTGLRAFRVQFPDVELVLRELNSEDQIKALNAGRIDVGMNYPHVRDDSLTWQKLARAPFIVAIPASHPLSSRTSISIGDLAKDPFVAFPRSSEAVIRDAMINMCSAAGFSPIIAQEASQIQTVLGIVASGLGVSLIPEFIRYIKWPGVRYKPLTGTVPTLELAAVWRSDGHSPLIRSFVNVVKDSASRFYDDRAG